MTTVAEQLELPDERLPIDRVFTPNNPIQIQSLLAGRMELIWRCIDILNASGMHLILYGDRGVGKTSVARVVGALAQDPNEIGRRTLFTSCSSVDTFSRIWERVFSEIYAVKERRMGFGAGEATRLEPYTLEGGVRDANDVRRAVLTLPNPMVIVIDEFDRVPLDNDARTLMADTIKLFADNAMDTKIVIVGVGSSVDELVQAHGSIPRHAAPVEVEPMKPAELASIIEKGFPKCGMTCAPGAADRVAELSQGFPHYTHLLGLWSGRNALADQRMHVTNADIDAAIPRALENAIAVVREQYQKAVESSQPKTLFKEVLLACALAKKDQLGKFSTAAVRQPLRDVTHRQDLDIPAYQSHLAKFTEESRGCALRKSGAKRMFRWQFTDPQLIPYVLIQGVHDKMWPS